MKIKRNLLILSTYLILFSQTLLLQAETLHTISVGGNWNDPAIWVENRIPTTEDIVEINGTVSLNAAATVAGLNVNPGAILQPVSGSRALTITGDLANNGTLQNNYYALSLYLSGNIINNGTWTNQNTYLPNRDTTPLNQPKHSHNYKLTD
jgi:hypothetical protein